jgi:hypothetical protein
MSSLKLSDQALSALMMALQKSLIEQTDIVPVLQEFEWKPGANGKLYVENPPTFKITEESFQEMGGLLPTDDPEDA